MGSKSKQPAARIGDIDTGHPPAPPTPIATGSSNVFIGGKPAARKGDMLVPHHPGVRIISEGSGSVNIGGMPAARVTDAINCGGKIAIGSNNVFIGDNPPAADALAPGEWQDYIDSSIAAGNLSTYQSQQMRANMAVKYRGKAAGSASWKEYYSDTVTPRERPVLASVQDPIEREGLQQAINQQPDPAPVLPNPAQQQIIDNAGQQMQKAIANLAEGAMVTPEMLNLASTMLRAKKPPPAGLHNQEWDDVNNESFKTAKQVVLDDLAEDEETAKEVLLDQDRDDKEIQQILSSGDNFTIREREPGSNLYGFGTGGYNPRTKSAYWLDEASYKSIERDYYKNGMWDRQGIKDYLALPCKNRANALYVVEVTEKQMVVESRIVPAKETIRYFRNQHIIEVKQTMSGGGTQITPASNKIGEVKRLW